MAARGKGTGLWKNKQSLHVNDAVNEKKNGHLTKSQNAGPGELF